MQYNLDGIDYEVVIIKKNNKNIYVRVHNDLKIYVTCNYFTNKLIIKNLLDNNKDNLRKMLNQQSKKIDKNKFFYLGKSYDIIINESIKDTYIDGDKIYSHDLKSLDKWLNLEIIRVFDERYVIVFNKFKENIKSPILKIRSMKTRWGVYNRKNHTITLNSRLIEFDYEKIDYVIIHELSHILHFDHSKQFWQLVEKYCPNYKKIRKEMKE